MLKSRPQGFTLIEVIVAVAIVALMAGALAPAVYRQINSARSRATSDELELIEAGLLSFYEDTGRFPTETEGLSSLVSDPGVSNWQGPYVSTAQRNPADAIREDAFGRQYIYDLSPVTDPAGAADVVVASCGADLVAGAGSLNHPWDLDADTDDLFSVVSAAAIDRLKENEVRGELETISGVCGEYFQDRAAFPASLSDLSGAYLDAGFEDSALRDPWKNEYMTILYGGPAPTLRVYSYGPDQRDDSGADDDLSILVSSVPPGRRTTLSELAVVQAALNDDPDLDLSGGWAGAAGVRGRLGLGDVFDLDGWGNIYGVNISSRVIYSCGPDGGAGTRLDNIPSGVGP